MPTPRRMTDDVQATPLDPVLYSFRRCPYAMRARLALAVSGTRCELREVKLSAKPQAMLAASPKGTVPVLVLSCGKAIDQSLDIMRWALANRDPEGWLARDDAALIDANDGPFKHNLDRYKYPELHGVDALIHRKNGVDFLREIDARLARAGQLGGPARGLSDAAIMPFVRQFAAIDREWFDTLPLAHLKVWLDEHLASDLWIAIMVRFKPWSLGDPPAAIGRPIHPRD
jgi:glutathione S-transferase